ncbi:helicase [Sinorhizobium medicae]|uniref:DEAD/DEAH box helicase n=1 Tax=Sinorhizobium medicae TaxID=110321 RepID=UPI000FDC8A55|nr:DEAD/DEAH box helicase [Sinorhizobium medicae]MDW9959468.1 helicase [Sinorhizobium meliloti]RVI91882.1 helicase [Sinorhizobium medicae]
MTITIFGPGELVRARGREWVVLPGSDEEILNLRPIAGGEKDVQVVSRSLEIDGVESATFQLPDSGRVGPQDEALLLRDAFQMSLRRGAGPFRSAGRIGFDPRSYQLVPLMMGLKLDVVRLLIADDVGIGKTIEAGLIARELYDRGEIESFSVLCPPHLVKQWVDQLRGKFHFPAVAVTPSSAARLERELPMNDSIFRAYPFTVVSLDYVKSDVRRDHYAEYCPELSIVDEAHTCVSSEDSHQRYRLIDRIAAKAERHMLLLTATPHSGDDMAYGKLLGLLDPDFRGLVGDAGRWNSELREKLAERYVQRRRVDIEAWNEAGAFPKHEVSVPDATYRLAGDYETFLELALDYCTAVVEKAGTDERKQRLAFWGTLALMRCIGSSPAAALHALRTRSANLGDDPDVSAVLDQVDADAEVNDLTPSLVDDPDLAALISLAEGLVAQPGKDPKIASLVKRLKPLIAEGFKPIIFCRYIATAKWVRAALAKEFKSHRVEVVTGELPSDDRKAIVDDMVTDELRVLVATDCLSEGIDLQELFDAVVHYDLSWNPTRHQQRNGRVDRFGQLSAVVRSLLVYGENNPVDGAVLEVILRKAEKIQKATGVPVPLPDDDRKVTEAVMKALLLRRRAVREGHGRQLSLNFEDVAAVKDMEQKWLDAAAREKANLTIFAQRSLKPEDVRPEWERTKGILGDQDDVETFVRRALAKLNVPVVRFDGGLRLDSRKLPSEVVDRMETAITGPIQLLTRGGTSDHLHRAHPLVSALADLLIERSLDTFGLNDPSTLPRAGAWTTSAVPRLTTVLLLRIRHQIASQSERGLLLAEETDAVAFEGASDFPNLLGSQASTLLGAPATQETSLVAKQREVRTALARLDRWKAAVEERALRRSETLVEDHRRIRQAVKGKGRIDVTPVLPVDIIGLFVLMPELD